ncbi:hypothetical protein V1506DRAFT_526973 [Lipomyces tetrasporus]
MLTPCWPTDVNLVAWLTGTGRQLSVVVLTLASFAFVLEFVFCPVFGACYAFFACFSPGPCNNTVRNQLAFSIQKYPRLRSRGFGRVVQNPWLTTTIVHTNLPRPDIQ